MSYSKNTTIWYNVDGDMMTIQHKEKLTECFYGDQINAHICLMRSLKTNEIIGVEISFFKKLVDIIDKELEE